MSLFSLVMFVILLLNLAKSDIRKEHAVNVTPTIQNFKEYMTKMIKEQSSKIQMLLKSIEMNAQTVLKKIKYMNERKIVYKKDESDENGSNIGYQIESPLTEDVRTNNIQTEADRSFSNHYVSTGFGASGSPNYGVTTYHHHSIGFDPINIVVSMSLLSFLLQALQGILTRTALPTPVVEAKSFSSDHSVNWAKKITANAKDGRNSVYLRKDYFKKKPYKKM